MCEVCYRQYIDRFWVLCARLIYWKYTARQGQVTRLWLKCCKSCTNGGLCLPNAVNSVQMGGCASQNAANSVQMRGLEGRVGRPFLEPAFLAQECRTSCGKVGSTMVSQSTGSSYSPQKVHLVGCPLTHQALRKAPRTPHVRRGRWEPCQEAAAAAKSKKEEADQVSWIFMRANVGNWLVVWNMNFIFHILGIVTPTD